MLITDSVMDHNIHILKYNALVGSSYIKLPKALHHLTKVLINIQNIEDHVCFNWCFNWYLHPADHNPKLIRKADKDFAKIIDFKGMEFPFKIRDIHKTEKNEFYPH